METIKTPSTVFRQGREIPDISKWELEKTLLEMYYEYPEVRRFIEDLAVRLNLNMGLEQLRKHLEDIEKFEKEVKNG